jgi:hypothetical protein
MKWGESETGGCVAALLLLVILVGIGSVPFVVPKLFTDWDRAEAQRLNAEAALIRAETNQAAQRQENWEHSYMMWTTALAAFLNSNTCILVLSLGALAFVAGIMVPAFIRGIEL